MVPDPPVISARELSVPKRAQSLLDKAMHAVADGKLDEAQAQVNKMLSIAPEFPNAIALRAEISLVTHQNAEALADAEQAVKLDPQSSYAQFVRASVLNSLARFDDAKRALSQFLPAPMLRAYLLMRSQMIDSARKEIAWLKAKAGNDARVIRLQEMLSGVATGSERQIAAMQSSR